MTDSNIRELAIARADGDGALRPARDAVAVEAPLEIRVDGAPGAVTMRTPGHDDELVRGFLFAEGVIAGADELRAIELVEHAADELGGAVIDARLVSSLARRRLPGRGTFASSSCGVCGKVSLASLAVRAPVIDAPLSVAAQAVAALPERLRAAQRVFARTGGLHAAGAFAADGALLAVREDVGRHNAVDKLVGWALADGRVPAASLLLCVSGRLSFELVQKAILAGFPVVCAVSAPSSLAVTLAERFGVTLCGFVRGGRFNLYAHPHRITAPASTAARDRC